MHVITLFITAHIGLSKWVRNRIQHEPRFEQAMSSLKAFADARMKADGESSDVSSIRYVAYE